MVYEQALGPLTYAQYRCYYRVNRALPFAEKALAANPNDFDAMLTWVYAYPYYAYPYDDPESFRFIDDEPRVAVLRRLHEMNPNHPYVLHELAKAIYPRHAQEALGYAKKAQQLEYRYIWQGLDGVCYVQLGDYENALAAFERAHAAVDEYWKPGTLSRIERVKRVMNNPESQKILQKDREENRRIMFHRVVVRH